MQEKTLERLSIYRRLARRLQEENVERVFSHDLARMARITASLVRRDLMDLRVQGRPQHGYPVAGLVAAIDEVLDAPTPQNVALVGLGQLGRALLSYYIDRPHLRITAAFDVDPLKVGRLVHGVRCHDLAELAPVVRDQGITLAIVAVPAAQAHSVARVLCAAGVRGILNFAPVRLHVPEGVFVEDLDFTVSLEKLAFLVREGL